MRLFYNNLDNILAESTYLEQKKSNNKQSISGLDKWNNTCQTKHQATPKKARISEQ